MTIRECYNLFDGDYEGILGRLGREELIQRFAFKFLQDQSFENLCKAMAERDYQAAFAAVHTLKGGCQNMGFGCLCASTHAMTEALRAGEGEKAADCLRQVKKDYQLVTDAIRLLQEQETKGD